MAALRDEIAELLARRDALRADLLALARQRVDAEDALLDALRRRWVRESAGPDATNAHLAGIVRDLARSLEDARDARSRALRDAQIEGDRLHALRARRASLERTLARLAQAAQGEAR